MLAFSRHRTEFYLTARSRLALPTQWNGTSSSLTPPGQTLHDLIVQSILVQQSHWPEIFRELQSSAHGTGQMQFICIGSERCVPDILRRDVASPSSTFSNTYAAEGFGSNDVVPEVPSPLSEASKDHVAVIGMACQLPGAVDMGEFWELLRCAKSQHVEIRPDRINFDTAWRRSENRKWYGNLIQDIDMFDARFFGKSPREAAATDPQQRLMLQVAYQAVEQSGYLSSNSHDKNVGCYVALGLGDYEGNVACHQATAYSATGNLRAFAAGKISHHFGWTGPALTIDSACSSSAVAVHLASQAIRHGECITALVGGVNVMTGPDWFYNLAGASFLSTTGQCKSFDAAADGYCRGEAVGCVMLKKLSSAINDGDQIFGVLAASTVQQNMNTTAITVPNSASLTSLFERVTRQAGISPADVSYVEAHGTGTPVGDPVEYDSIRRVFGGSVRKEDNELSVGSVKGLLGHGESSSGMVGLLKILAMMHHGSIPPQASFRQINPALQASPRDHMRISTSSTPWNAEFKAALINNYGASGSNASLLVTQPLSFPPSSKVLSTSQGHDQGHHPFLLHAYDEEAVRRYCTKFLNFIRCGRSMPWAAISFQLSRQSNRALRSFLSFSCKSLDEVEHRLETWSPGQLTTIPAQRPVILCFGGQRSTYVGLDKQVYDTVKIFRDYIDSCNVICESLGTSILPALFQKTAIQDLDQLHAALFSLQYACARSWLDCMPEVEIAGVVGHSFGELSALCVSGAVSLEGMLKYILSRARLIGEEWGPEKGAMIAVEADKEILDRLLSECAHSCSDSEPATIACFNTPNSFTIAGPVRAIDEVVRTATEESAFATVKTKRIDVTNAYHCSLTDAVLPKLRKLSSDIRFQEPRLHVELSTERGCESLDAELLVEHLRLPVYFSQAVQRLAARSPAAVWLEASSDSGAAMMAKLCLEAALPGVASASHFQPVDITGTGLMQGLSNATIALRREGVNVSFWPHHCAQTREYPRIMLPPYQFEKTRHWTERRILHGDNSSMLGVPDAFSDNLWAFMAYQDDQQRSARFRVNTSSDTFQSIVKGHAIAQSGYLCPSTLQLEIAIEALSSMRSRFTDGTHCPQLREMKNCSPLPLGDESTLVWLDASAVDVAASVWEWTISGATGKHATGTIAFAPASGADALAEFAKLERLVRRERCASLLDGSDVDDEVIQGRRHIYRVFEHVVKYGPMFQGLLKIVARKGQESAGRVVRVEMQSRLKNRSWLDCTLADCFLQVAGIFVNAMTNKSADEMYISDGIDQWIRSPRWPTSTERPSTLDVYACHTQPSDKEYFSDVFVFDPQSGAMIEAILGIHFQKVSKKLLRGKLGLVDEAGGQAFHLASSRSLHLDVPGDRSTAKVHDETGIKTAFPSKGMPQQTTDMSSAMSPTWQQQDIASGMRAIIASLAGLESAGIQDNASMIDLGIDSLMWMELGGQIEMTFGCETTLNLLSQLTDFRSLVDWVEGNGNLGEFQPKTKTMPNMPEDGTVSVDFNQNENEPPIIQDGVEDINGPRLCWANAVLHHFADFQERTDEYITNGGLARYTEQVLPASDELCLVYVCDAFERLGCHIRSAAPGQELARIKHHPRHERFVALLYELLERKAGLIELRDSGVAIRTAVPAPDRPAGSLLQELNDAAPAHSADHSLLAWTSRRLADCLSGTHDGVQLIFGTPEGRELATAMYGRSPFNSVWLQQLGDFLRELLPKLAKTGGTIRILELGAGTGGTTSKILPMIASLRMAITYTFSDISPSLVAVARKRFEEFSFAEFRRVDIEEEPPEDLRQSYHIVLGTNCIHATHNITDSTRNVRSMLCPDGFLLLVEMTMPVAWIDLIFGLVEGWWHFNDGRKHALVSPEVWRTTLHAAGYSSVRWSDGKLPENAIQRLILAMAGDASSDQRTDPAVPTASPVKDADGLALAARQNTVDQYVWQYTQNWFSSQNEPIACGIGGSEERAVEGPAVVLVTGASGSLGCHLTQYFASRPDVSTVVCLNRPGGADPRSRQEEAMRSRGVSLTKAESSKLRILQANTHMPLLGLTPRERGFLADNVTHFVHTAWPMSIKRPLAGFEPQFKTLRYLLDLAHDASTSRRRKIVFQFISSISVVGLHPLWTADPLVPEVAVSVESALPMGYADAKLVCERMVEVAAAEFPRGCCTTMSVRIGQISGSRSAARWNPNEHFAFIVKSSQTLNVLPDLGGTLSWCPVDDVAASVGELLLMCSSAGEPCHEVYHVENPKRQSWQQVIQWFAEELGIPTRLPLPEWLELVRASKKPEDDNPAIKLVDFLSQHFVRVSCGGLVLDIVKALEISKTLKEVGPVDRALVTRYVRSWKAAGFLK